MNDYNITLKRLEDAGNLRRIPSIIHQGKYIEADGRRMINLSSNDYLGLAGCRKLREEFLDMARSHAWPLSSSSSRLLTGNGSVYESAEQLLADRYGSEAALLLNSGYHANVGILPALADRQSLIVADKLIHASLIDGIRLSGAAFLRYRHQNLAHLRRILDEKAGLYKRVFVVTESIFSMDGDVTDLVRLAALKRKFPNVLLYVDEAHAVGVRGLRGLGIAEETGCLRDIDLLIGTFGKALASMGAYVICNRLLRDYLVNTMRPLIFSTALPPLQVAWSAFVFRRLPEMELRRRHLRAMSRLLADALTGRGGERSESHIVPLIVGENAPCVQFAEILRRKGFYCLPVRPPTVPQGTARIRFSLTADVTEAEAEDLLRVLATLGNL